MIQADACFSCIAWRLGDPPLNRKRGVVHIKVIRVMLSAAW